MLVVLIPFVLVVDIYIFFCCGLPVVVMVLVVVVPVVDSRGG